MKLKQICFISTKFLKKFLKIIRKSVKYNKSKNFLSGGCAMNCLANGKLSSQHIYEKFLFHIVQVTMECCWVHYYLIIKVIHKSFQIYLGLRNTQKELIDFKD